MAAVLFFVAAATENSDAEDDKDQTDNGASYYAPSFTYSIHVVTIMCHMKVHHSIPGFPA